MTLKPCPFCGAQINHTGIGSWHVDTSDCPLSGYVIRTCDWNTRADEARIRREVLAEVRAALAGVLGGANTWRTKVRPTLERLEAEEPSAGGG